MCQDMSKPWMMWYYVAYIIYHIPTVFQVNLAVIVSLFILLPRPIITHSTAQPTGKEVGWGRRSGFVSKKIPLRFPAMYQSLIVSPMSPLKHTENAMAPMFPPPELPHLSLPRRSDGGEHTARRRICSSRSCSSSVIFLGKAPHENSEEKVGDFPPKHLTYQNPDCTKYVQEYIITLTYIILYKYNNIYNIIVINIKSH